MTSPEKEKITRAQSIIMDSPVEALNIIDSLELSHLTKHQRADVEIIRGEARYRLDSIDIHGDSLMSISVDYYRLQPKKYSNYRSYFLRAYEYGNQGKYVESVIDLLYAERSAALQKDTLALGLIYRGLADYFYKMDDNGSALNYARKSYDMFHAIHSGVYENWALGDLARAYANIMDHESAISLLKQCIDNAIIKGEDALVESSVLMLGRQYNYLGRNEEALEIFEKYRTSDFYVPSANYWVSLGRTYISMNNLAKAIECQDSLSLFDEEEDILKYGIADKTKNYENAYKYLRAELDEQNKVLGSVYKRDYSKVINDYFLGEIKIIDSQLKFQTFIRNSLIIIIFSLLILGAYLFVRFRRRRKIEQRETIAKIKLLEETVDSKNIFINRLSEDQNTNLEKARGLIEKLLESRIKEAEQLCLEYESTPSDKRQQKIYNRIHKVLTDIKAGSEYVSDLEKSVNHIMNNIMADFRRDYPSLNEREYAMFLFMVLGFSTHIICLSQDITVGYYYTLKSKLKRKIMGNQETAQKYLLYF